MSTAAEQSVEVRPKHRGFSVSLDTELGRKIRIAAATLAVSVPVYVESRLVAIVAADLEQSLAAMSFVQAK